MVSINKKFSFVIVFLSFLTYAGIVQAATYYVATNGSDSNSGSESSPFKNIQKAADIVKAGDTVIIRAGTHAPFKLRNVNGTSSAPITFRGEAGAVIDRNYGDGGSWRGIEFWGGSYITIDSLELTDSSNVAPTGCTGEDGAGRNAIKLNRTAAADGGKHPHHITFTNLHIHRMRSTAILGSADYLRFINNHVHDNGARDKGWAHTPEAYGTYLKGRYLVISGNRIYNHSGNGIRIGNDPSTSNSELIVDSVIENNVVYNNGGTWSHPHGAYNSPEFFCEQVTGGDGIVLWHGSGNIIRNNIIYGNVGYGIRTNENTTLSSTPNVIYNNTVYKNGSAGLYSYPNESTIFKNNISYLNAKGDLPQATHSNNLTTDPKFVNPAAGDFGLQEGSPALDKGVTLAQVIGDFTGKARPEGEAYDIGAFEGAGSRADVLPGTPVMLPTVNGGAGGAGSGGSFGLGNCLQ